MVRAKERSIFRDVAAHQAGIENRRLELAATTTGRQAKEAGVFSLDFLGRREYDGQPLLAENIDIRCLAPGGRYSENAANDAHQWPYRPTAGDGGESDEMPILCTTSYGNRRRLKIDGVARRPAAPTARRHAHTPK